MSHTRKQAEELIEKQQHHKALERYDEALELLFQKMRKHHANLFTGMFTIAGINRVTGDSIDEPLEVDEKVTIMAYAKGLIHYIQTIGKYLELKDQKSQLSDYFPPRTRKETINKFLKQMSEYILTVSFILERCNECEKAIEILDKYIDIVQKPEMMWYRKAQIYSYLDKKEDCIKCLIKASSLNQEQLNIAKKDEYYFTRWPDLFSIVEKGE